MNTANYLTAVNRAGEAGHYPLSTETLDFNQQQIILLSHLAKLSGTKTVMLKTPTTTETGVAILSGEVVEVARLSAPLVPNTSYKLELKQTTVDVSTADDVYKGARTMRVATLVKGEDGWLKTDSLRALFDEVDDLDIVSDKISRLSESIAKSSDIQSNSVGVPLYEVTDGHFEAGFPTYHVVSSPESYHGWPGGNSPKYPFYLGGLASELKGAVLKSQIIDTMDSGRPGLAQTLTTRHGVVYERFVAPQFSNGKFSIKALESDIPWHARPNSIIGTLSKTKGGDWVRSGIMLYGDLFSQGTTLKLRNDRHSLLRPERCCLQVSVSIPQSGPMSNVTWSLTPNEGLELNLPSSFFDNQFTSITITAIALPIAQLK
nr:MAG TPA: hypothetical protein [Caudoviricetes sp.]